MLQGHRGIIHLALLRQPTQLPDQLGTLRKTGGAQWVSLRQQPARRVGDHPAAVGVVTVEDEFLGGADRRQAEGLVGE